MGLRSKSISILIASITFATGSAAGVAWSWWKTDDRASHTQKLTVMKFYIDDEGCDSGFTVGWLANSYLVSSMGERLGRLEIPATEPDSCAESDFVFFQVLVKPTDSWVYRLEIASPSSSLTIDKFTVRSTLEGDDFGPAYVYISLSADCTSGTLLCL